MAYQLRERNRETLDQMKSNVVSVEANLLAKKARLRNERRVTIKEETPTSNLKIDNLSKKLERMMDRLDNMEMKPQWDNQQQGPQLEIPISRKTPTLENLENQHLTKQ